VSTRVASYQRTHLTDRAAAELSSTILARYLLVTHQSGAKAMSFSFDSLAERPGDGQGRVLLDCAAVWTHRYENGYVVALRGALAVQLVLVATPQAQPVWRIESFVFDSTTHDKYIQVDSVLGPAGPVMRGLGAPRPPPLTNGNGGTPQMPPPPYEAEGPQHVPVDGRIKIEQAWVPADPCNGFGIPQATMRCLEVGPA
jgi:hypothetical protein